MTSETIALGAPHTQVQRLVFFPPSPQTIVPGQALVQSHTLSTGDYGEPGNGAQRMKTVRLQTGQEGVAPTWLEVSLFAFCCSSCDPGEGIPRQQELLDAEQVSRTDGGDCSAAGQGVSEAAAASLVLPHPTSFHQPLAEANSSRASCQVDLAELQPLGYPASRQWPSATSTLAQLSLTSCP